MNRLLGCSIWRPWALSNFIFSYAAYLQRLLQTGFYAKRLLWLSKWREAASNAKCLCLESSTVALCEWRVCGHMWCWVSTGVVHLLSFRSPGSRELFKVGTTCTGTTLSAITQALTNGKEPSEPRDGNWWRPSLHMLLTFETRMPIKVSNELYLFPVPR